MVNHEISLFFYIKGSKDYPMSQRMDDRFGYTDSDSTSQKPIFGYSIKDVYNKSSHIKDISNLYSLVTGGGYGVPGSIIHPSDSFSAEQEFLSTMLVQNGDNVEYNEINPNFSITDLKNNDFWQKPNNPIKRNMFWSKMFQIFEFIKTNERLIATGVAPTYSELNYTNNPDFNSTYNNETIAGKYLGLFIGGANFYDNNERDPNYNVTDIANINTWRGTYTGVSVSSLDDPKHYNSIWKRLGIRLVPGSTSSISTSANTSSGDRLSRISFVVQYYPDGLNNGEIEQWKFNVYLTPDSFVSDTISTKYRVYTFNDLDLSDQYVDHDESKGFNVYDNDYAHTLNKVYGVEGSQNYFEINNNGENNSEMQIKVIDALTNILKDGEYTGYEIFRTQRTSPYIKDGVVIWEQEPAHLNKCEQKFYVFYNTKEKPSSADCEEAVRTYLKYLHGYRDSHTFEIISEEEAKHKCKPETRDDNGNVIYIGHETTNESDIINFLSKMYTELFSVVSVHVIPCIASVDGSTIGNMIGTDVWDPTNYMHPIDTVDIYNSMRTRRSFNTFEFSASGTPSIGTGAGQINYPIEIFYLGGEMVNGDTITYDFPLIATQKGNDSRNPLTSIPGINTYKQRTFDGISSSVSLNNNPADKLQFVLLKLYQHSFVNDMEKGYYESIAGVSITYEYIDNGENEQFNLNSNQYNVAKFTISSVEFVVYPHFNKSFGNRQSAVKADPAP